MNIHHICIQTNSYKESLDFYLDVLNFKLLEETKDFNDRNYNTWVDLNGFKIELQTGKKSKKMSNIDNDSEGIAHFCLYSDNFDIEYCRISSNKLSKFKKKNGSDIYNIENNRLFKLIAPEGTIIEVRDTQTI